MQLTRRQLLGGVGLGTIGVGGVALGRGRPGFTNYAYANTGDIDDRRLRVAWYERYNGRFRENQNGTTDPGFDDSLDPDADPRYVAEATAVTDATGPVVAVDDVLPGDEGTLVVGLQVVDDEDFVAEPLDVWLRAAITADDENGINGPESLAGDTTVANGELDDHLTVELWRDGSPLGTCNGDREFDESLEGSIVPRTPVSVAFGPSSAVAGGAGIRILGALAPGDTRCVALDWEFPVDTTTNRAQGDGLAFELAFGGAPAGERSPFETPTEGA